MLVLFNWPSGVAFVTVSGSRGLVVEGLGIQGCRGIRVLGV